VEVHLAVPRPICMSVGRIVEDTQQVMTLLDAPKQWSLDRYEALRGDSDEQKGDH
jgi:hypothetical protein